MGQQDVLSFLSENKGEWFYAKQIANHLRVNVACVNRCLVRMRKHSEIEEKKVRIRFGLARREVSFYGYKEH